MKFRMPASLIAFALLFSLGCQPQVASSDSASSDRPGADELVMDESLAIKTHAPVSDSDLARIGQFKNLKRLNIDNGQFTDAGLKHLKELPHLELLRIRAPQVTDAGLAHIAQVPALRFLHLIDVPVTDAGIAHLEKMTKLESFYLDGGQATDSGLQSLLQALPKLHFHRNQLHLDDDPLAD